MNQAGTFPKTHGKETKSKKEMFPFSADVLAQAKEITKAFDVDFQSQTQLLANSMEQKLHETETVKKQTHERTESSQFAIEKA